MSYQKVLKDRYKAEGRCIDCGKLRGKTGTSLYCRYHANMRIKQQKERRIRLNKLSICVCGKKKECKNASGCFACLEKATKRDRARSEARIAAGLCPRCGEKNDSDRRNCSKCRKRIAKIEKRYRTKVTKIKRAMRRKAS